MSHAVVRAWPELGGVLVTVVDRGRGFDPGLVRGGVGIAAMVARLGEVGGEATVESSPRQGTRVRVWAPREAPRAKEVAHWIGA